MPAVGRVAAATALALSAALLGAVPAARGGCVAPVIGIGSPPDQPVESPAPVAVDRSSEITIAGKWFFDGCADVYVDRGCGPRQPLETQTPKTDVRLVLTQGTRTWTLAAGDAGPAPDYAISWRVSIPTEAENGAATISADGAAAPVVITDR